MTKVACIFPGQGSQYVGMGNDLYVQSAAAREVFRRADAILGVELSRICFEGPADKLKQTENTQPAIFLHSYVITTLVGNLDARMAAGHSLGEYTALVFAGALRFEDGLKLVRLRGELMQRAGEEQRGTMAAVVGLPPEIVVAACAEASADGVVQCANFNSNDQIVISGSVAGVRRAIEIAKSRGAKLVKELPVSGAFHSPLMQSASDGLKEALANTAIGDARIPIYANVTARPVQKAEEIRTLLEQQLTSPVRWTDTVKSMVADEASIFVEIGPGRVLQGLVKRTDGNVQTMGFDTFDDVRKLVTMERP